MNDPPRLCVVTFNIHAGRPARGPADLRATARAVAGCEPDVLGLQEVCRFLPRRHAFADQPAALARLLGLKVSFLPSFGVGAWGFGNAILSRQAPERLIRVALPGCREPRVLLEAWLRAGDRPYLFLNTHLGLEQEERMAQATVVAERVRRAPHPVILVGDLNADPESKEIQCLEEAGLTHCLAAAHLTFPSHCPAVRLDYVMVSAGIRVETARVIPTLASDHLPVVVRLELAGDGPPGLPTSQPGRNPGARDRTARGVGPRK